MAVAKLPEGFVLDPPVDEQATALPPGFVLDASPVTPQAQSGLAQAYQNIVERPGAAMRGAIQALPPGGETPGQGYVRGSVNPSSIPTFQQQAINHYYQGVAQRNPGQNPTLPQTLGGMVPSAMGLTADVVTNPVNALMGMLPEAPGIKQGIQALGKTVPAQAIAQFLTKERALNMFHKTPAGKLISDPAFEQLAGNVRQAVGGGKLAAGINFDQGITDAVKLKPDVATPISDFIENLKTEMKVNPAVAEKLQQGMYRSGKQGNTTLQAMLTDESRAASATGRDLQNIKQTLQSVPSIDRALQRTYALQGNPRLGRFDATVGEPDLILIDHLSDLRGRLMSSYPELQNEYGQYSQFMNDYRTLAPRLRSGSMEHTLLEKWGNPLQRQAAGRIVPSEILQQVEQVRTNQQQVLAQMEKTKEFHKVLKKLGWSAVAGTAAGLGFEGARKLIPHY